MHEGEVNREKIRQLRDKHIHMYKKRLGAAKLLEAAGHKCFVNVDETTRLLRIWEGMEGKRFDELGNEERLEVLDAIESGE